MNHTTEGKDLDLVATMSDHEQRIAWLEAELARIARKVDASLFVDGYDTPTPRE